MDKTEEKTGILICPCGRWHKFHATGFKSHRFRCGTRVKRELPVRWGEPDGQVEGALRVWNRKYKGSAFTDIAGGVNHLFALLSR